MIYAYLAVAAVAQLLDILTWAFMPHAMVREGNALVIALGPKLALDAKVTVLLVALTLIMDFWWWRPGIARLTATAYVLAGSAGALSNMPH